MAHMYGGIYLYFNGKRTITLQSHAGKSVCVMRASDIRKFSLSHLHLLTVKVLTGRDISSTMVYPGQGISRSWYIRVMVYLVVGNHIQLDLFCKDEDIL